jgi:hypothetical protein
VLLLVFNADTAAAAAAYVCLLPCMQVAEVLVSALRQPSAANKVVEIVSSPAAAPAGLPEDKWFEV